MTHSILYMDDNTHVVEVLDLRDHQGALQTDAVVNLTELKEARSGQNVTGITLPLLMPHVGSGNYRAVIAVGLGLTEGKKYYAKIKAVGSQSFEAEWRESLIAEYREE